MELTWKGFGIRISVQREPVEGTPRLQDRRAFRPYSPEKRREIEKEYILASGNRYGAPTR